MPQTSEPTPTSATQPNAAVWTDDDLRQDPHAREDKATRVRAMFGAIAGRYDLNNRVHSLWRDQAWRRFAVKTARVAPGEAVLDVACGTGDLTELFARRTEASRVVGADFTPEMLDVARVKQRRLPTPVSGKVEYQEADATALPFDDDSFDVVSIAFGIRNVQQPERAFAEFARVLRPGGRLIVLEFDTPGFPPARWINNLYCKRIMPVTATLISGDRSGAYKYLPKSVGTFATSADLRGMLTRVGFEGVRSKALTFGICVCTSGVRPKA